MVPLALLAQLERSRCGEHGCGWTIRLQYHHLILMYFNIYRLTNVSRPVGNRQRVVVPIRALIRGAEAHMIRFPSQLASVTASFKLPHVRRRGGVLAAATPQPGLILPQRSQ